MALLMWMRKHCNCVIRLKAVQVDNVTYERGLRLKAFLIKSRRWDTNTRSSWRCITYTSVPCHVIWASACRSRRFDRKWEVCLINNDVGTVYLNFEGTPRFGIAATSTWIRNLADERDFVLTCNSIWGPIACRVDPAKLACLRCQNQSAHRCW